MRQILTIVGGSFLFGSLMTMRAADPADLQQRTESFTIFLHGSVAEVTPLFGPVREAEWAPTWKPRFIHPSGGAQREGAVFTTISANGKERFWLLKDYDEKAGQLDYVFFTPGFTVNEIKIRLVPDGEGRAKAMVTYRHSALAPAGNEEVMKLDSQWAEQQRLHWESAINAALAKGRPHD